jgi:hypothetical protein
LIAFDWHRKGRQVLECVRASAAFERGMRKRNCRSALQSAARARQTRISLPSILCIPHSSLSVRPSRGDYSILGNEAKTFHRFSGMIFFEGVRSPLVIETQLLAKEKVPQIRENTKNSSK